MTRNEFLTERANEWFEMAQESFHMASQSTNPRYIQMEYYHALTGAIRAIERYTDATTKGKVEYSISERFTYNPEEGATEELRVAALEKLQEYVRISSK